MIAKIGFTVYGDFEQYLKEENDYEYNVALHIIMKHFGSIKTNCLLHTKVKR